MHCKREEKRLAFAKVAKDFGVGGSKNGAESMINRKGAQWRSTMQESDADLPWQRSLSVDLGRLCLFLYFALHVIDDIYTYTDPSCLYAEG